MARNFLNTLLNRQQTPYITPIQMGADGKEDIQASLALQNQTQPLTLKERLIGRELTRDVDTPSMPDENGQAQIQTERYTNYRPGLLNDLSSGYRDNYATGFAAPNWNQQQTPDGRNKGFAFRLGEGLGTVGRFIDSPLGRGLIAAGLNKALGYDNSLQEGLTAAVGRQNAQTADKVYRQQLAAQGIDTSDVRGNMTSDMYRQLLYGQQLKDNAEYRKMYYDNQQRQNEIMNQLRRDQLERQERQDALKNQIDMSRLGLEGQKVSAYIENLRQKANKTTEDKAALRQLTDNQQTLADIDAGLQMIEENPQAYTWLKGKVGADIANRIDPKGVPTRTQIDNITAVYRKWLTGAQMSDAERKAYERFLPAPTDNAHIVKSKLQGMKNSIERKNQVMMQGMNVNQQGGDVDPLGIL